MQVLTEAFFTALFLTLGVWLCLMHYHKHWVLPEHALRAAQLKQIDHKLALLEAHDLQAVREIDRGVVETLHAYHEMRLLPALQLLAAQRIDCAPPPVEEEPVKPTKLRAQLEADQIENVWNRVAGTC